jgi:hypothetical protein
VYPFTLSASTVVFVGIHPISKHRTVYPFTLSASTVVFVRINPISKYRNVYPFTLSASTELCIHSPYQPVQNCVLIYPISKYKTVYPFTLSASTKLCTHSAYRYVQNCVPIYPISQYIIVYPFTLSVSSLYFTHPFTLLQFSNDPISLLQFCPQCLQFIHVPARVRHLLTKRSHCQSLPNRHFLTAAGRSASKLTSLLV